MSVDHIRYDLLVRDALRGVVRRVVADVAKNGLPGDHHFYISFDTRAPGVRISSRLREQYPEEMTIVLQHQFWDLAADDDTLEVGLSFGGVAEKLVIPYDALKGFFDPSVQFGLEFEVGAKAGDEPSPEMGDETLPLPVPGGHTPARTRKPSKRDGAASAQQDRAPEAEAVAPVKQDGGAEVVRLDRFRKK